MRRRLIYLVLFALILLSLAGSGLAQELEPEAPTASYSTRWAVSAIESGTNRGSFGSLTYDPKTDVPHISYYDQANGDLRMASLVVTGGNCGPDNIWNCQTVPVPDTAANDVGRFSDIDIHRPTGMGVYVKKIGITFIDTTHNAIIFGQYVDPIVGTDYWSFTTIYDGSSLSTIWDISFQYDSSGVAHIAYSGHFWNPVPMTHTDSVKIAQYVGSGGNCGPDEGTTTYRWRCDSIDSGTGKGKYLDLDFVGSDYAGIAYYDSTNNYLRYALEGAAGSNCGPGSNTWMCRTIDLEGGMNVAVASDPDEYYDTRFASYNPVNGDLEYAYWVSSGGNCGFNSMTTQFEFNCITIENMAVATMPPAISLALNSGDSPAIAYQYISDDPGPSLLKTAIPTLFGNCGPTSTVPFNHKTWSCAVRDNGDAYLSEAYHVSASFNQSNLLSVAYSEYDDYYSLYNLKILRQEIRLYLPVMNK